MQYSRITLKKLATILTLHTASMMLLVASAGTILAWGETGLFDLPLYLAVLAAAFAALLGTNALNNYSEAIEFSRGNKKLRSIILNERNSIPSLKVNPAAALAAGIVCYSVTAIAGLFIMAQTSWFLLIPGAFGVLVGITYTNGPAPLVKLPITELLSGICVGGIVFLAAYFIQAGGVGHDAIAVSLIVTFAVSLVNSNNHLCDVERDRLTGRGTFALRYGSKAAILFNRFLFAGVSLVWIWLGFSGVFGFAAIAGLLPFAIAVKYSFELKRIGLPSMKDKMHLEKFIVLHVFANGAAVIIASVYARLH